MKECKHYNGNNYCNLYEQCVASAYCGDICKQNKINIDESRMKNGVNTSKTEI